MDKRVEIGLNDKKMILETGKLAKQAGGAVVVTVGGTVVLVSAVASKNAREGLDFFPLTVEYQERTYAAGKIPGGFFKREGKPPESSVLTSRLIDRPIRPLFPDGMSNEVQVIAFVISYDGENEPDMLAMNGASAALSISDIPWDGPAATVRVGRINDEFILNPTAQQMTESAIDLIIVGTEDKILMIESGVKELSEETVLEAIKFGQSFLGDICKSQKEFAKKYGKAKREDISYKSVPEQLYNDIKAEYSKKMTDIVLLGGKAEMNAAMDVLKAELVEKYITEESEYTANELKTVIGKLQKAVVREYMLSTGKRVDNRELDEIRDLNSVTGLLPRTHGSGVFTRGQTQALAVTTLGTSRDSQIIDALGGEYKKHFMLHYNFPPFSVGEAKPMRGPGRREIGHGALAERGIKPVLPTQEDFPYAIRVVSDILESNGSSSMATVCATTLSLMDAGVPIKAPVAGIAMGLVTDAKKSLVLTDIAGVEDHFGDMDFKVAGTKEGITAIQLDMKISGFGMEILEKAFSDAKKARLAILASMEKEIAKPREEMSEFAPRIHSIKIPVDKIRDIIGPGGKMIKKIVAETGADLNVDDTGVVQIASNDGESMKKAIEWVEGIIAEAEVGKIYNGTVTRVVSFGAFCEILPGKEGLVHVSEIADGFVKNVGEFLKEGDPVTVKCIEIDDMKRVNLSIKQALPKTEESSTSE